MSLIQCKLDSSNASQRSTPNARVIRNVATELGMIDIWRELTFIHFTNQVTEFIQELTIFLPIIQTGTESEIVV